VLCNLFPLTCKERAHLERKKTRDALAILTHDSLGPDKLEPPSKSGGEMSVHVLSNGKVIKLEHEERARTNSSA